MDLCETNTYNLPSFGDIDAGSGMPTLYRVAFRNQLDNPFKYGYNRAFTGTAGGNMYGPGVYCTFLLSDSQKNLREKWGFYGDCIVSMKMAGGYDKFIIFDERLAKQTYGNRWKIRDQFVDVMGIAETDAISLENECQKCGSLYKGRTSPAAVYIWRTFKHDMFKSYGVRGLIYKGSCDGHCALPYDFSSVIPYAVSFDGGKTFKKRFNKDLYDYLDKHPDVEFKFGGRYDRVLQSVNGFTMVMKGKKFNVVENRLDKLLSPVWFDSVDGQINHEDGTFDFSYGGIKFTGSTETPEGGQNAGYICDPDGDPYCDFGDLSELLKAIKESGAKSFEEYYYKNESRSRGSVTLTESEFRKAINSIVCRVLCESRSVDDGGRVTIDNFDDAKRLINAENNDDVWFVQIIKRHKDNMHLHFHRNACEFICSYLIHDAKDLDSKRDEIMHVCQATNARAYLQPNKRSMVSIRDYAEKVLKPRFARHKDRFHIGHEIEVAAGQSKDWPERKICFLDIDSDDVRVYRKVMQILSSNGITPIWEYRSLNNGWHIVLPDKEKVRNIDFSIIDNGNNFGRFSTVGLEIDKPILLYASLTPNGYGLQKNVQSKKLKGIR